MPLFHWHLAPPVYPAQNPGQYYPRFPVCHPCHQAHEGACSYLCQPPNHQFYPWNRLQIQLSHHQSPHDQCSYSYSVFFLKIQWHHYPIHHHHPHPFEGHIPSLHHCCCCCPLTWTYLVRSDFPEFFVLKAARFIAVWVMKWFMLPESWLRDSAMHFTAFVSHCLKFPEFSFWRESIPLGGFSFLVSWRWRPWLLLSLWPWSLPLCDPPLLQAVSTVVSHRSMALCPGLFGLILWLGFVTLLFAFP